MFSIGSLNNENLSNIFRIEVIHTPTAQQLSVANVKESIEVIDQAISLYDKYIEREISWKGLGHSLDEMDKFRKDIFSNSETSIQEIKMNVTNAIDAHFLATQNVYEWAQSTASSLKLFIRLYENHDTKKANTQKQLILQLLESGVVQLRAGKPYFKTILSSFNAAADSFTVLRQEFAEKFAEHSKNFYKIVIRSRYGNSNNDDIHLLDDFRAILKFYGDLEIVILQAIANVVHTYDALLVKAYDISELKNEYALRIVVLDESSTERQMIIKSAQALIAKCDEFQRTHNIRQ